jgi:hypothetical protein
MRVDHGQTWTQISPSDPNDLPGPPPAETENDPAGHPLKWKRVGTGLPATPGMSLNVDGADTTLFVGTFGRGIWKIPLPTS